MLDAAHIIDEALSFAAVLSDVLVCVVSVRGGPRAERTLVMHVTVGWRGCRSLRDVLEEAGRAAIVVLISSLVLGRVKGAFADSPARLLLLALSLSLQHRVIYGKEKHGGNV